MAWAKVNVSTKSVPYVVLDLLCRRQPFRDDLKLGQASLQQGALREPFLCFRQTHLPRERKSLQDYDYASNNKSYTYMKHFDRSKSIDQRYQDKHTRHIISLR